MRKTVFLLFFMLIGANAQAASGPERVVVAHDSAALYFSEKLDPRKAEITVPESAQGLRWIIGGAEVAFVEERPLAGESVENGLFLEKEKLAARLEAVNAAIKSLQAQPRLSGQEIGAWQTEIMDRMPALIMEKNALAREIALFPSSVPDIPSFPMKKIVFSLTGKISNPEIHYSYEMPNCGWTPVYDFVADMEKDETRVALFAELRQFSGLDWKNAEISFVSGGGRGRLSSLRPWYLEARPKNVKMMRAAGASFDAAVMNMAEGVAESDAPQAQVRPRLVHEANDGPFASWGVPEKDMPQGLIMTKLSEDVWKNPLEWVARPGLSGSVPAFVIAKHSLSGPSVWPRGRASYGLILKNGDVKNVGEGVFSPSKGEVTLDFGPDWQVMVHAAQDMRKRGETGLISTSNTWSWAWRYTVTNSRDKAVKVRVERPQALAVDKDIRVKYVNRPEAELNTEDKSLVWNIEVPAGGETAITHQIEISAPDRMNFEPVPPGN